MHPNTMIYNTPTTHLKQIFKHPQKLARMLCVTVQADVDPIIVKKHTVDVSREAIPLPEIPLFPPTRPLKSFKTTAKKQTRIVLKPYEKPLRIIESIRDGHIDEKTEIQLDEVVVEESSKEYDYLALKLKEHLEEKEKLTRIERNIRVVPFVEVLPKINYMEGNNVYTNMKAELMWNSSSYCMVTSDSTQEIRLYDLEPKISLVNELEILIRRMSINQLCVTQSIIKDEVSKRSEQNIELFKIPEVKKSGRKLLPRFVARKTSMAQADCYNTSAHMGKNDLYLGNVLSSKNQLSRMKSPSQESDEQFTLLQNKSGNYNFTMGREPSLFTICARGIQTSAQGQKEVGRNPIECLQHLTNPGKRKIFIIRKDGQQYRLSAYRTPNGQLKWDVELTSMTEKKEKDIESVIVPPYEHPLSSSLDMTSIVSSKVPEDKASLKPPNEQIDLTKTLDTSSLPSSRLDIPSVPQDNKTAETPKTLAEDSLVLEDKNGVNNSIDQSQLNKVETKQVLSVPDCAKLSSNSLPAEDPVPSSQEEIAPVMNEDAQIKGPRSGRDYALKKNQRIFKAPEQDQRPASFSDRVIEKVCTSLNKNQHKSMIEPIPQRPEIDERYPLLKLQTLKPPKKWPPPLMRRDRRVIKTVEDRTYKLKNLFHNKSKSSFSAQLKKVRDAMKKKKDEEKRKAALTKQKEKALSLYQVLQKSPLPKVIGKKETTFEEWIRNRAEAQKDSMPQRIRKGSLVSVKSISRKPKRNLFLATDHEKVQDEIQPGPSCESPSYSEVLSQFSPH